MIANRQSSYAFQSDNLVSRYRSDTNSAFPQHRVPVPGFISTWVQSLQPRFSELTSLQRGWDGYHGKPVSFVCASFAAALLERICNDSVSAPTLVPGSDGTLQIEWHKNKYDIEIDVIAANNVVASRFDHVAQTEIVLPLENDFSELMNWIKDMASERVNLEAASA
jgi:hypothetical protein